MTTNFILTCVAIVVGGLAIGPHKAVSNTKAINPQVQVWLGLKEAVTNIRVDPHGRYLAYLPNKGNGIRVLQIKTRYIYRVSKQRVGGSFFWAPAGHRLFYRELHLGKDNKKVASTIKVFDVAQRQSHHLDSLSSSSGFLTFDPRDLTFRIMHGKGLIKVKKIYYPDNRLAKWQVGQRTQGYQWLATQKAILVVKDRGATITRLADDQSGIASFMVAPRGQAIIWGTNKGNIYLHDDNGKVQFIDRGRDPAWHPSGQRFVYAKAIYIGNKLIDYDLRFADRRGYGRYLTRTRYSRERWPNWLGEQIVFTREKTMDLFAITLVDARTPTVARGNN